MEILSFWHGQMINPARNCFKYWRGWTARTGDGKGRFYYQYGRMRNPSSAGTNRVSYKEFYTVVGADSACRRKTREKQDKGYEGKWYARTYIEGLDFPLPAPSRDWQLSKGLDFPTPAPPPLPAPVPAPRQVAPEPEPEKKRRRSPLDMTWRLEIV